MELLAPWSLAGLVLVPAIFLWGLLAPRGRPVVVGSLMLWKRALGRGAVGKPSARVRLKDPLLWLDALLVLVIVLACAQPALRTRKPMEPVATIVIDRTASMGAGADEPFGMRWRQTQAMLAAVLTAVDEAPIRIVSVPGPAGATVAELTTVREVRDRYGPEMGFFLVAADVWPVALAEAARRRGRPVVVATDVAPSEAVPENVYVLAPGAVSANAGLVRVATRIEDDGWWVLASAKAAPDAPGTCNLVASTAGKVHRTKETFLSPGQEAEMVLPLTGPPPQRLRVDLKGPGDSFLPDDSAFLVLEPAADLRVLLVGQADPALRRALAARTDTVVLQASGDVPASAAEADLVIASGAPLPPAWKGPAAVIAPPEAVGPVRPAGGQGAPEWRAVESHPLAEAFYLDPPRLAAVGRYAVDASAQRLLGAEDTPLMVTWEAGGARRLAVLFGFDEATTDWSRRAAFPIFWSRALDWLVPQDRRAAAHRTHAPLGRLPGSRALARNRAGFQMLGEASFGVSFIGTEEGFEAGPGRDDSAAAVEAIIASIEARRRATLAPLWPYLAAVALIVVLLRTWLAR